MILLFAASLFFVEPAPIEMPRAEGWLVKEEDKTWLEDRYHTDDLWFSQAVAGRWFDSENGREFMLADLKALPPSLSDATTRTTYEDSKTLPDKREDDQLRRGLAALLGEKIPEDFVRPHQKPKNMKDVRYYEGTNLPSLVCAYLPAKRDYWSVVVWDTSELDDRDTLRAEFEDKFWEEAKEKEEVRRKKEEGWSAGSAKKGNRRKVAEPTERDLLKRDAMHSVVAYECWNATPGEDFVILDDLPSARGFIVTLTNDLAIWRGKFAAALPTPIDTSNALCVARIFRNRADFLVAAGPDMQWAAAYWCQSRRELVACLPPDGDRAELRRTFRHESFHQYLSYATAMVATSPWLNEGYAQYFEDECRNTFDLTPKEEQWDELELSLPALMMMDYEQFYEGTDELRRKKYRLAWSIAYFMEHGMREIRHDPFANLKPRYFAALAKTRDMRQATLACFDSTDQLKLFCNEWKKFWKIHYSQ